MLVAESDRSQTMFPCDMQEIVVFRDDLQNRMRKLCLLAPNSEPYNALLCLSLPPCCGFPVWH